MTVDMRPPDERLKPTRRTVLLWTVLATTLAISAESQVSSRPDTVVIHSGTLSLRGLLWRPHGPGPFPAVLFNHGSGHATGVDATGRQDQRHPDALGPVFAKHGYVLLYLFRRGDGLSRGQGVPAGDFVLCPAGFNNCVHVQLQCVPSLTYLISEPRDCVDAGAEVKPTILPFLLLPRRSLI